MQLPRGDSHPPLLLGLHLLRLHFTSEMNESLMKHAFLKPCFDTQPMAFPSEVSYSPATPYCPFLWPSSTQLLHLLLPQPFYNAIQLIRKCALMHSVPNSLRDHLWFNRLKDTETWSWNVMLRITYLSSLYTTLLTSPPPPSPPLLPPLLPSPL